MRSEIDMPDGSSPALVIFMPEETCARLFARSFSFLFSVFSVFAACILFFTTSGTAKTSLIIDATAKETRFLTLRLSSLICPEVSADLPITLQQLYRSFLHFP